jgi:hypothetical protein
MKILRVNLAKEPTLKSLIGIPTHYYQNTAIPPSSRAQLGNG